MDMTIVTRLCDYCGKRFERNDSQRTTNQNIFFCSKSCHCHYEWEQKKFKLPEIRRVEKKNELTCTYCGKTIFVSDAVMKRAKKKFCDADCLKKYRDEKRGYSSCYLKEARAMLAGKHWKGKNKCTKLIGDKK